MGKKVLLKESNPVLFSQIDQNLNPEIDIQSITSADGRKVTWKCARDHTWQTVVRNRVRENTECPYCSKKRASPEYNLATEHPYLARQWSERKNQPAQISEFLPSSMKEVWWICDKGHEWKAAINGRARGNGCPYCSNRKVGFGNDFKTNFPELADQWHPSKNGPKKPSDFTLKSSSKVYWLCKKGHSWQASIRSMADGGGCPYCLKPSKNGHSSTRASDEYNFAKSFPELVPQWSEKNEFGPETVTPKSVKKAWWECPKGHEYLAQVNSRSEGRGCPYCAGKRVSKDYNLSTEFPELVDEWHFEKNGTSPGEYTPFSGAKVWWRCSKGHEWQAKITNRSGRNSKCPYCAPTNGLASPEENLETKFPQLLSEWDWKNNKDLHPREFKPGSTKKVYWQCQFGHIWKAAIYSRTSGRGCPKCRKSISRAELRVFSELQPLFDEVEHNVRVEGIECDILVRSNSGGIAIELDGKFWHRDKVDSDKRKNKKLGKLGIEVIRLRDTELGPLSPHDVIYDEDQLTPSVITRIIKKVCLIKGVEIPDFLQEYAKSGEFRGQQQYESLLIDLPLPKRGNSFQETHPQWLFYWDFDKNKKKLPHQFTAFSKEKIHWKCENGHQFTRSISVMARSKGCPHCNEQFNTVAPNRQNSFGGRFPELLQGWSSRNRVDPFSLPPKSNKEYWFECEKGHEWKTSLDRRGLYGCPYCAGQRVSPENSLAAQAPFVAAEWDYERNGEYRPENISVGTKKIKPFWKCSACGFGWQAMTYDRVRKRSGCPRCRNRPPA